jgi:hypothetical protein
MIGRSIDQRKCLVDISNIKTETEEAKINE